MKIKIKGVPYSVKFREKVFHPETDEVLSGYCDYTNKKIIISSDYDINFIERVVFHELLHAYFAECGLYKYEWDEILIHFLDYHIKDILTIKEKILKGKKAR